MNKKTLIYSLSIAIISLIFAGTAIYVNSKANSTNAVGNLLLQKSYTQALKISKIVITTPQKRISMQLKDNFWRVNEADDYYANLIVCNALFISFNEAEIKAIPHLTPEKYAEASIGNPEQKDLNPGTLIETYNEKGEKIESVIIGNRMNNFQYARYPDSSNVFLVSGNFEIPQQLYYWLQQPVISLNAATVEKLTLTDGDNIQEATRQNDKSFMNLKGEKTNPNPFFEWLKDLTFVDVMRQENFNNADIDQQRNINIELENGLIHNINLLKKQDEYWISIKNSTTTLPTIAANDYISESSFLTDGWIFKLRPEIGKLLLNFNIGSSKIYVKPIY